MTIFRSLLLLSVLLPSLQALADCPRVPGQEDDRRANAGCLIVRDQQVLLISHRWGGKLGVPGGTLEPGELAQCTAYRETLEESGVRVVVGERLQVMKNGFHLYRCHLQQPVDSGGPVDVPRSGLAEVSAIDWYPLSSLSKARWRFEYQFEQFLQVAAEAMQGGTAPDPDSASNGQPEK
ncbi:hypothetical protein A3754_14160 [Alcanivorax sp. HI0083]|uniref:NUDIX hydrolase n=1 Tax=unclassified Alcanivorax TaxID=2638842 RepID=UPI0007B82211|nr:MULTISPECIES: NUDIX domain-containing protein [unclassified Alcanivorax]KZY29281.1 hypothetical protein A3730_07395 [Alcanivorax sp. HI0044]KZZ25492.1 hypothetical protein A3754_14160 [Alcanivorax sp. HI0083]